MTGILSYSSKHKQTALSRRDFLKVAGSLTLGMGSPGFFHFLDTPQKQNVIIIVFDALSAHNVSLFGYPRETMPNLSKLAERAVVYHNHYAGGNFTTPGTASLLTGALPWTHRAINNNGTVVSPFKEKNIFTAFPDYHRITYSHNPWVYTLLEQFVNDTDVLVPLERFLLLGNDYILKFLNDEDIANISWMRVLERGKEGYSYSLFLSHLYEQQKKYRESRLHDLVLLYPRGIPSIDYSNYFLLEDVINWLCDQIEEMPQPFLGYFHFWPPHEPYKTHRDFYGRFAGDGWIPVEKPHNPFSYGLAQSDALRLPKLRMEYDETILYADREFGRLFSALEKSNMLENTWIILTSDHGESFERGIEGHSTAVLYQPLIHIPLIIFEPGRRTRQDIDTPTSAIDLLPTLLHVTGHKSADWGEGVVIPPYASGEQAMKRSIYSLEARMNGKFTPLTIGTAAIIKEHYKLMYSFGYAQLEPERERMELYDIHNDPEELNNLYISKRETAAALLDELKTSLAKANALSK